MRLFCFQVDGVEFVLGYDSILQMTMLIIKFCLMLQIDIGVEIENS